MATPNVRNILRIPSRLAISPTDLTTDYPHGGTALGLTRDLVFHFGAKTTLSTAEEWGGVVTKAWYSGEAPFVACVLRELDNDALAAVFPNTSTGSVSQNKIVSYTPAASGYRPGLDLAGKVVKLVVSPLAADRHPFILLYAAVPTLDAEASLMLSYAEEVGIPITWHAMPDSSNRVYRVGTRADLNPLLA